jgi:hypothetical protein
MQVEGTILDLLQEIRRQVNSLGITRKSDSGNFERNSVSLERNINRAENLIKKLDEDNVKMNSFYVDRFVNGKVEFEVKHDF